MLIEKSSIRKIATLTADDELKCIVCLEALANSIFHPCGHSGLCFSCSKNMIENNTLKEMPSCHYCRKVWTIYKAIFRILRKCWRSMLIRNIRIFIGWLMCSMLVLNLGVDLKILNSQKMKCWLTKSSMNKKPEINPNHNKLTKKNKNLLQLQDNKNSLINLKY